MATPVFLPGKSYGQSGAWQASPSPWDCRVRHNLVIKTKHLYFLATLHCMWDLAFLTRDWTGGSCSGNTSLSCWTTREVPIAFWTMLNRGPVRRCEQIFNLWQVKYLEDITLFSQHNFWRNARAGAKSRSIFASAAVTGRGAWVEPASCLGFSICLALSCTFSMWFPKPPSPVCETPDAVSTCRQPSLCALFSLLLSDFCFTTSTYPHSPGIFLTSIFPLFLSFNINKLLS